MVDFVGLLKKTIDAQNNADQGMRQRIYDRTRETVNRQMANRDLPEEVMNLQRRTLDKAINTVENFYQNAEADKNTGSATRTAPFQSAPSNFQPTEQRAPNTDYKTQRNMAANTSKESYQENHNTAAQSKSHQAKYKSASTFQPSQSNTNTQSRKQTEMRHPQARQDSREEQNTSQNSSSYVSRPISGAQANKTEGENTKPRTSEKAAPTFIEPEQENKSTGEANTGSANFDKSFESLHNLLFGNSAEQNTTQNNASKEESGGNTSQKDVSNSTSDETSYNRENSLSYSTDKLDLPFSTGVEQDLISSSKKENHSEENSFSPLPDFFYTSENEAPEKAEKQIEEEKSEAVNFQSEPEPEQNITASSAYGQQRENQSAPVEQITQQPVSGSADYDFEKDYNIEPNANQQNAPARFGNDYNQEAYSSAPEEEDFYPQNEQRFTAYEDNISQASENNNSNNNGQDFALRSGNSLASSIFSHAAKREQSRERRNKFLIIGAIVIGFIIILALVFWFLTGFFSSGHKDSISISGDASKSQQAHSLDKSDKRLTSDGKEVTAPAEKQDAVQNVINGQMQAAEKVATGVANFKEMKTALMPETNSNGTVNWSLLQEKTPEGFNDTVLRGEINIPEKDIFARLTMRPNHDASIPAVYLMEVMFTVPEKFEGGSISKISPVTFKATEQSTGQELLDMNAYKINNNFFVLTMNSPQENGNPRLQRNIALMQQLPWISMNVAYDNGRIAEFDFDKGSEGNELFKQFFDAQSPKLGQIIQQAQDNK